MRRFHVKHIPLLLFSRMKLLGLPSMIPGLLWLVNIQTGTSLKVNGPNVCSYWESYTTAVKESYAHPYSQSSPDTCDTMWSYFKACTPPK
ncbi:hypothetical protein GDO81_005283 [Engystomops pustulosus]|uniref:EMI domain-containing protein n=1 Tax=Engystomops pustulosus TaxID=76066 RepID=A0AAV7CNL7_ENGPU|nr:hypothetical protein GDO81_005283 [Engystomops pustulosus]